jgi:hypothetical protein
MELVSLRIGSTLELVWLLFSMTHLMKFTVLKYVLLSMDLMIVRMQAVRLLTNPTLRVGITHSTGRPGLELAI